MNIVDLVNKAGQVANANSTTILTSMGVSGTMTTAYLAGRASWRASRVVDREEGKEMIDRADPEFRYSVKEKAKMVWPMYIPAVVSGGTTIAAIIMANQLASKKIAAITVASGITERAFQEYKEKVVEKLGKTKDQAVRDAVAQDRVNQNPPSSKEVILAGTGEILCMDLTTGRYFQSTIEEIKRAENKINFEIMSFGYASLSSFYDEIGLPPTSFSDDVGWNFDSQVQVTISTAMSPDNRPVATIDFSHHPQPNYNRFH